MNDGYLKMLDNMKNRIASEKVLPAPEVPPTEVLSEEDKRIMAIWMRYAFGKYLPHSMSDEPQPRRDGTG